MSEQDQQLSTSHGEQAAARRDSPGVPSRGAASVCLLCGAPTYGVHCKQICPNCGYREDCSDIFPIDR